MTVNKNDWNLSQPESFLLATKVHFYLERISIGGYRIKINGFQYAPAKAFESAGTVGQPQTRDHSGVHACKIAEHEAAQGPVYNTDAVEISGPDDEVVLVHLLQKTRQHRRVVGEIRIHLDNVIGPFLQGVLEALPIGRSQPELARTVQDMDPSVPRGHTVGDFSRTVRRIIVNNENLEMPPLGKDIAGQPFNILPLIIGRYNYNGLQRTTLYARSAEFNLRMKNEEKHRSA